MKVVIFSRVSTAIQDYQRQTDELTEYANKTGHDVVGVFEEIISGAKKNEERVVLMDMMKFIKQNKVEKVLTWELSRIGRRPSDVLWLIDQLNEMKVSLYIKNYNLDTLNDDNTINPLSQFMIQILNSVSMMERLSIRQRMESGYRAHLRAGKSVGRKPGKIIKDDTALLNDHKDVVKNLKAGFSVRQAMKLTGKSSGTVQKIKKLIQL